MTDNEIIIDAIRKHPDCAFGIVRNGIGISLNDKMLPVLGTTRVVQLWRNEECYNAGDPSRHVVESYPAT